MMRNADNNYRVLGLQKSGCWEAEKLGCGGGLVSGFEERAECLAPTEIHSKGRGEKGRRTKEGVARTTFVKTSR